jgi:hypothetical protein
MPMLDVGETDGNRDGVRVGTELILGNWLGIVVEVGESEGIDMKDGASLGIAVGPDIIG